MDEEFWHKRWQDRDIAFHRAEPNPVLLRNFPALGLRSCGRVFLPLCGKSLDIHWFLANGFEVAGVELSQLAVDELFAELKIEPRVFESGALRRYETEGLTVYNGNLFELNRNTLGKVDAVYDRAALVALPEQMRQRYTAHLIELSNAAAQLLVCYEYNQAEMEGPPFSISDDELRQHYESTYALSCLDKFDVEGGLKGQVPAMESVWMLSSK